MFPSSPTTSSATSIVFPPIWYVEAMNSARANVSNILKFAWPNDSAGLVYSKIDLL